MVKPFHGEQCPLDGMMGLIQQCARHRHLRVFESRIPASFLLLEPAPYALAVGRPRRGRNVVGKTTQLLAQRKHAQALPLTRPGEQGVKLRAQGLADRRRDRHQFLWELVERVAQAVAEARSRKQRAHALGGTVEPIGQNAPDPIGWLLLDRRALERLIGLRKGRRTGVLSVTQMPDNATTDNGRQVQNWLRVLEISAGH